MKLVHRIDAVTLLRQDAAEVTAEGFRLYDAHFARTGLQVYGETVEYRPADEVEASFASYELRPLTDLHPPRNVTTDTARVLARGATSAAHWAADQIHVAGRLAVWDGQLIDAFDAATARGTPMQLSAGYELTLDETPGTTPEGERYDAIQRDIRINHVAAVPLGRAGTAQVLTDAAARGAWRLDSATALAGMPPARDRVVFDLGAWCRRDAADLRTQTQPRTNDSMNKISIKLDGKPVEITVAADATPQQLADAIDKARVGARKAKLDAKPGKRRRDMSAEGEQAMGLLVVAVEELEALLPEADDTMRAAVEVVIEELEQVEALVEVIDEPAAETGDMAPDDEEEDGYKKRGDSRRAHPRARAPRVDAAEQRRLDAERVDVFATAKVILGLGYRCDTVEACRLAVVDKVLGRAAVKAIARMPRADQSGAAAYAFSRAVEAHEDAPKHHDALLDTIRAEASRHDGGEDPLIRQRLDAEQRARNPNPNRKAV